MFVKNSFSSLLGNRTEIDFEILFIILMMLLYKIYIKKSYFSTRRFVSPRMNFFSIHRRSKESTKITQKNEKIYIKNDERVNRDLKSLNRESPRGFVKREKENSTVARFFPEIENTLKSLESRVV